MENIGFLFDLDGVIIDSEPEYSRIWSQINREFPTGIESFENKIKGCTLSKILEDNYEESVREAVCNRLHELEQKMHYEYLPGSFEFLSELKRRGLPMALVTSSDNKKMAHLEEEMPGFLEFFDFIVTAELVSTSKPSPEGYLLAAKQLNAKPEKCVVFEDSLQGVMAGNNAKAYVVGVTGTLGEQPLKPYSDILTDSLEKLNIDNLIQSLNNR